MKKFLFVVVVVSLAAIFMARTSQAATLTETQVGGETAGAISIAISKYFDAKTASWKRTINISYETRDASNNVIRTGTVTLDYDTMTAAEKAYVDGIISKALNKAKNAAQIP